MTHVVAGLYLWAMAFIATPPTAASPNHCEHIIVIMQEAADDGLITQGEADEMISRCSEELWG